MSFKRWYKIEDTNCKKDKTSRHNKNLIQRKFSFLKNLECRLTQEKTMVEEQQCKMANQFPHYNWSSTLPLKIKEKQENSSTCGPTNWEDRIKHWFLLYFNKSHLAFLFFFFFLIECICHPRVVQFFNYFLYFL